MTGQGGVPTRGEIWLVRLPRAMGAELQRDRPAVLISSPRFDGEAVRIIVPLSTWSDDYVGGANKILVEPSAENGLVNRSAADFFQIRSVSVTRLLRKIGDMDADLVDEIVAGVIIAIDYQA